MNQPIKTGGRVSVLKARWVHLVMLNYEVDPNVLQSLVPPGTLLDSFQGKCFASVVGFQFRGARLFGIPVTEASNLALARVTCSLRKAAKSQGIDPLSGLSVQLFDPRREKWLEHFTLNDEFLFEGLTPTGRATIETLGMNRPTIVSIRKELNFLGRFCVGGVHLWQAPQSAHAGGLRTGDSAVYGTLRRAGQGLTADQSARRGELFGWAPLRRGHKEAHTVCGFMRKGASRGRFPFVTTCG